MQKPLLSPAPGPCLSAVANPEPAVLYPGVFLNSVTALSGLYPLLVAVRRRNPAVTQERASWPAPVAQDHCILCTSLVSQGPGWALLGAVWHLKLVTMASPAVVQEMHLSVAGLAVPIHKQKQALAQSFRCKLSPSLLGSWLSICSGQLLRIDLPCSNAMSCHPCSSHCNHCAAFCKAASVCGQLA